MLTKEAAAKSEYNAPRDDLFCKYCGKQCKSLNSLNNHQCRCKENPDRIESYNGFASYNNEVTSGKRSAWNKGLTKEIDLRVKKNAESLKEYFQKNFSDIRKQLQPKLDDDGKLYSRFANKRVSAKYEGLECELTFDEYLMLVDIAGLKSSQLGFTGEGYVLARYNDEGNYTFENCRFITQKENMAEQKLSAKMIEGRKTAGAKLNKHNSEVRKADPESWSNRIKNGLKMSEKNKLRLQRMHEQVIKARQNMNLNYIGVHNSQYGTFWITNGIDNKKWRKEKGEVPEGFYRGRTIKKEE